MEIKWSKTALHQLDKALDFIINEGYASYAAELEESILQRVENLIGNHTIYPIDKYKKNNDGSYHAFEVEEYRVSYRVKNSQIKIIRIRHTSRRTLKY
ncbi:MAG TPA: type II toxin-antitoxin system RelE/ParE family toxin [Mucilaginibacter sp.]